MTLHGDTPTILLPVETVRRELDSKLALAARAIGSQSLRVVWQGKDAFSEKGADHFALRLRGRESAVMFFQEEGAIFPEHDWERLVLQKHRADFIRAHPLDRLCAWGERQGTVLASHGLAPRTPISVTGSPRFDLCAPEYSWLRWEEVAADAEARRPYILMCTRFTSVAHQEGMGRFFRASATQPTPASLADQFTTWHRDAHDLADFVVLVKEVATAYPRHGIVVRPHPSESAAFYRDTFAGFKTVSVVAEGSVIDWIRAADVLVHCNCTTGVEAVFAGRPVVNMQPTAVPRVGCDKEVAREAGLSAVSVDDALAKIGSALSSRLQPQVWSDGARSMLRNLVEPSIPLLVRETLAVFAEKGISSSGVVLPAESALRKRLRGWLGRTRSNAYVASKRGALDVAHIERVLDGCRTHAGGAGRVAHVTPEYVVIEPS